MATLINSLPLAAAYNWNPYSVESLCNMCSCTTVVDFSVVLILKLTENGPNVTLSEVPDTAKDDNSNPVNRNKSKIALIV